MQTQNYTVEPVQDTLRITIKSPKNRDEIIQLAYWVLFRVLGTLLFVGFIFFLLAGPPALALEMSGALVWVFVVGAGLAVFLQILWTGLGLYLLLWNLTGKLVLEITPQHIEIRQHLAGFSQVRQYDAKDIRELKALSPLLMPLQISKTDRAATSTQIEGPIAFRYKGRAVRTGLGLDARAALTIVETIHQRVPFYQN